MAKNRTKPDVRTIALRSGGSVTVQIDYSVFDLDNADREFVTELVDLVQGYEAGSGVEAKAKAKGTPAKA